MDSIETYIKKNLSEKRRKHVYGVVHTAQKLAGQYGCDREKAKLAAVFHDMFRSTPVDVLNMYVRQLEICLLYTSRCV